MSEKELIQKLKNGDREAFNQFVELYQLKVIKLAYSMLSSEEDAYDAAQETFIRVYKNIDSFKSASSLPTWIYRICANICNDMLRKRMKTKNIISIDADEEEESPVVNIADNSPTPDESYEMTERQQAVKAAIDMLSEEYKAVIVLYDMEGLSYEEIAEVLKCPIGTIKSRLNRARAKLKKILSEKRELFL